MIIFRSMSTIKSERYNLLLTDNFQPLIVMRSYSLYLHSSLVRAKGAQGKVTKIAQMSRKILSSLTKLTFQNSLSKNRCPITHELKLYMQKFMFPRILSLSVNLYPVSTPHE